MYNRMRNSPSLRFTFRRQVSPNLIDLAFQPGRASNPYSGLINDSSPVNDYNTFGYSAPVYFEPLPCVHHQYQQPPPIIPTPMPDIPLVTITPGSDNDNLAALARQLYRPIDPSTKTIMIDSRGFIHECPTSSSEYSTIYTPEYYMTQSQPSPTWSHKQFSCHE
jgi:hypothetical protein